MSPGNGVGRGISAMLSTRNPAHSSLVAYSPGVGKYQGTRASPSNPRRFNAWTRAVRILRIQPWPPHSATNRPPGFNERYTPASITSALLIQCSAALLNTASNSSLYGRSSPQITNAFNPSFLAASTWGTLESTATTSQPRSASFFVSTPSPQPRSRILSPGFGASSSTTGIPKSDTN